MKAIFELHSSINPLYVPVAAWQSPHLFPPSELATGTPNENITSSMKKLWENNTIKYPLLPSANLIRFHLLGCQWANK